MGTRRSEEPTSYRILDTDGRVLGRVQSPVGLPPLGPGAGTILLLRDRIRVAVLRSPKG
jgi:hypothetical protein